MTSNRVVNSSSRGRLMFGVKDDADENENDLLIRRRRRRLMQDELLSLLFISDVMEAGKISNRREFRTSCRSAYSTFDQPLFL